MAHLIYQYRLRDEIQESARNGRYLSFLLFFQRFMREGNIKYSLFFSSVQKRMFAARLAKIAVSMTKGRMLLYFIKLMPRCPVGPHFFPSFL
ncbi:hypothetical protein COY95_02705 [Candidatus Woesearchaeota archaeon CG_4_10_14_0_8_um_filter_47_5]|nr:MAG: hypothetical protein COY95_02705 [Candidatus Woesearchaeota archaeon CG_4_10_14_0_8_um_filter_47_5]